MGSARARLLLGELASARGRWISLGCAIALALAAVGTVMGARPLIARSMGAAADARNAAEATLILPAGIDEALLARVRGRAGIRDAERRQTVSARAREEGAAWQPVLVFAYAEGVPRLDAFTADPRAWPPARGAILVERSSLEAIPALRGARAELVLPGGAARVVTIAGAVHDPGVAPSWQEHRGYAYTTLETLVQLGGERRLEELVVQLEPSPRSRDEVEDAAVALARWLEAEGHEVREVRVPPLRQHPHQGLLFAVQIVLLLFSGLLLILVSVVLATLLSAQLGRKTRELGMLKAIGASTGQLLALYAGLVVGLGVAAFAVALPLSRWGAAALASRVVAMMNLELVADAAPSGTTTLAILAVLVPLAVTLRPIWKAARRPVREALAQYGAAGEFLSPALTRLPIPLRNALRRPARLAYSLTLLVVAGALVLAAANVQRGLTLVAEKVDRARRFDVEIRLHRPAPLASLAELAAMPGLVRVESWSAIPIGLAPKTAEREGHPPLPPIPLARTYRDGGHGLVQLLAPPAGSTALAPPISRGRWLHNAEDDAVVLSRSHPLAHAVALGDRVELVVSGRLTRWRLVGVVEELAGAAAFVTPAAFRRVTGETGVNVLRITTTSRNATARDAAAMEARLVAAGLAVDYAMPTPELRAIIDDHVALVTRAIVTLASLLALVGFFALGAMTAIGVAERTREIGVLKTLGASSRKLAALFLGEALIIAAMSALLAFALSVPLTELVRSHVALGSLSPQFTLSAPAALVWLVSVLAGSALAAGIPARRAARLSVRAALSEQE